MNDDGTAENVKTWSQSIGLILWEPWILLQYIFMMLRCFTVNILTMSWSYRKSVKSLEFICQGLWMPLQILICIHPGVADILLFERALLSTVCTTLFLSKSPWKFYLPPLWRLREKLNLYSFRDSYWENSLLEESTCFHSAVAHLKQPSTVCYDASFFTDRPSCLEVMMSLSLEG